MPRYDAFISYNRADSKFAKLLEFTLENYKPPKSIRANNKNLNIFRFEEDMVGVDYHKAIRQHLLDSNKLIVLCSPSAKKSKYVGEEIELFASKKSADNIITLLVEGIPTNEINNGNQDQDAFPEVLWEVQKMPLATEYRHFDFKKHKINKDPYQYSWYKLLADLLDKSVDEVSRKEIRRKVRRRNRIIAIAGVIIMVLLALSTYAFFQKGIAEKKTVEAVRSDSIAQIRKAEAEYEAQRAIDSARVAKEQRVIAQDRKEVAEYEAQRALDSAEVAKRQRKIAQEQSRRAEDSARVAKNQRAIAIEQTDIAIKNEAETFRINELLLAENLSFESLSITDPIKRQETAIEAYWKYKNCANQTSEDASREQTIYEALYKIGGDDFPKTEIELKQLFAAEEAVYGLGTNINSNNYPSYVSYDQKLHLISSLEKMPEVSSPANHHEYFPEMRTLITFHDDRSMVFWQIINEQIFKKKGLPLGNQKDIRIVCHTSDKKVFAAAGNGADVYLFNMDNDGHKVINTQFKTIVGLTIIGKDLLVFDQDGQSKEIRDFADKPIIGNQMSISKTSITTSLAFQNRVFLGLEDGKVLIFNTEKRAVEDSVGLSGNSRVEILYIDPNEKYLIASYAGGDVHLYDLRYVTDDYYKPRVIQNRNGKVRSLVVDNDYLFMTLSDKTLKRHDLDMHRIVTTLGGPQNSYSKK